MSIFNTATCTGDERPGDLPLACQALIKRGSGWVNRILSGLSEIKKHKPEVYSYLKKLLE